MNKLLKGAFLVLLMLCVLWSASKAQLKKEVNERYMHGLYMEVGFSVSRFYKQGTKLGLNYRSRQNWHINLELETHVNDKAYPLLIGTYLAGNATLRLGKQYRKGIWLYGASVGPSYFFKNQVIGISNFIFPDFSLSGAVGVSPKVSLIATPTRWLGLGLSYDYNLNSIENTGLLWFSVYLGRMRFRLSDYKNKYQNN